MEEYIKGVVEVSKDNDISVSEALGITDERMHKLAKIMETSAIECDRVSETIEMLWNRSNHPNEFAWMLYVYGNKAGAERIVQSLLTKQIS